MGSPTHIIKKGIEAMLERKVNFTIRIVNEYIVDVIIDTEKDWDAALVDKYTLLIDKLINTKYIRICTNNNMGRDICGCIVNKLTEKGKTYSTTQNKVKGIK